MMLVPGAVARSEVPHESAQASTYTYGAPRSTSDTKKPRAGIKG